MRTLNEILDASKTGGEWPTHEECFWAMQALEQLWMMTGNKYREQVVTPKAPALAHQLCDNDFQAGKRALNADPKTWLGPDRDYSRPENRKRRDVAMKLYDLAAAGKLPKTGTKQ